MIELPLFPLNLVLFPMQSLALHIFEDRYKEMIRHCIDTDSPFGIVMLERGAAEEGRSRAEPLPSLVGCTAHISQVQELPDGRMNIVVVGRERFKIHAFDTAKAYLRGTVEYIPVAQAGEMPSAEAVNGLKRCIQGYLQVLEKGGRIQPGARKLPRDPMTLGSLAAVMLHDISVNQRQSLLEAADLATMFDDLRALYRREIVLLEAMLTEPQDDQLAPFSPN
jgi:Lon protease-like protein